MSRETRRQLLEAAGVGHRITHEDDLPEPRELLAVVLPKVVQPRRRMRGAQMAVQIGKTLGTRASRRLEGEDPGECPDPTGELERGSPNTFIGPEQRAAVMVDEEIEVPCENCSDGPIMLGARYVFVNGKPWARRTDELDCGAFVGEGEPTVMLGVETTEKTERFPMLDKRSNLLGPTLGRRLSPDTLFGARWSAHIGGGGRARSRQRARGGRGPTVGSKLSAGDTSAIIKLLSRGS